MSGLPENGSLQLDPRAKFIKDRLVKKQALESILIFTDGACSGNPGPGGWGAVIATPDGSIQELGGGKDHTTNNEMELLATIESLRKVRLLKLPVLLYTDSTYVIRGITQWIWGWKKKDWSLH